MAARCATFGVLLLATVTLLGCSKKDDPPRWHVASHIGPEWTFTRRAVDETPARRIVAVCTSYRWQGHDPVRGEEACSIAVGGGMVEPLQTLAHPAAQGPAKLPMFDLLDSNTVVITEGEGADKIIQLSAVSTNETDSGFQLTEGFGLIAVT